MMSPVFQRATILLLLLSIMSFCARPASVRAQEQQQVMIPFTALGKEDKRFFTGLRKEDIRVLEDGVPQEIIKLEQQADLPLAVVIMIDTSFSQVRILSTARRAARAFLDSLIRPGKDTSALIGFASEAILEQGLTSDVERTRKKIDLIRPEDELSVSLSGPTTNPQSQVLGSSAIWDAIWLGAADVLSEAEGNRRRAIILISDGEDTSSMKKFEDALEQSIKANVTIFAIGSGNKETMSKQSLRRITERTGGQAFFPKDLTKLPPILAEMEQELRSQYLVTYSPAPVTKGGRMRKVKIEIVNTELRKQELRLSHRQGYFK